METFRRPIEKLQASLQGLKRSGTGWQARCPAHEDRTPSLSIKEASDGTVLIKCFAGCSLETILHTLGLSPKDLFPAAPQTPSPGGSRWGSPVAVYAYVDEAGALLFQTLRYEWTGHGKKKKTFRQRRPDGHGGWIHNLEGTRHVLYHLPAVVAAVSAGQRIFIVEGEKDADTLAVLGLATTTNPMGAGKWRESYSECLRGADVVLLPDQDVPSVRHMDAVARSLYGHAQRIRIVELPGLPPKGDVSDWLARGARGKPWHNS
ncbi:MAG: hypothetical protein HYR55_11405 [Acidobacteria bacterium]|nr:hypothetical protein [Acidobacteriota bacterium]